MRNPYICMFDSLAHLQFSRCWELHDWLCMFVAGYIEQCFILMLNHLLHGSHAEHTLPERHEKTGARETCSQLTLAL